MFQVCLALVAESEVWSVLLAPNVLAGSASVKGLSHGRKPLLLLSLGCGQCCQPLQQ